MKYSVQAQDGIARAGILETSRGTVETPVFMPVGTVGSVKGVSPRILSDEIGVRLILGNTYHLYLRPGIDVLEHFGGLHPFAGWNGPMLTDSGGFQVFSLSGRRSLDEDGVTFRSHLDGSSHRFTPENVVDMQRSIGADIVMVLDECPAADVSDAYARSSLDLTVNWAKRCKKRFKETEPKYGHPQYLFGIVQGVVNPQLRRESARLTVDIGFDGYAIGGLSVGEQAHVMYEMVEVSTASLPIDKPRYLMGVGTPENMLECVERGIDMFDCVMPTRNGRNGMLFTTEGIVNIRNRKWEKSGEQIDPGLDGYASRNFSKGYLRHLFQSKEILGLTLASVQNLDFYARLMREARRAVLEGRFVTWKAEVLQKITRRL
ncbi:MAG: tRNA guanosine(34) transglycosylase Tgt [Rhodothermia bacterium]